MSRLKLTNLSRWRVTGPLALILMALLAIGRPTGAQTETTGTPEAESSRPLPVPPDQVISGIVPDLPPGYMIVEGDIQVTFAEFEQRYQTMEPGGVYEIWFWPNGIVPFEFNANVTSANRIAMGAAMLEWENVTGVDFQQCANNNCTGDHVHIQNSTGNNSAVGRQGGEQIINIVNWSYQFIMAHELGHALGLQHEQSRSDRNSAIRINYNNVCKATDPVASCTGGVCFNSSGNRVDCDHNFNIATGSQTYGTYDFDSVMHYGRKAFSRNGNDTITVLPPNDAAWQNVIGQRTHLSFSDKNVMGCMYPRTNWRWVSRTSTNPLSGTCRFPYNNFTNAYLNTPTGGRLWIEPGTYAAPGVYDRPMTWFAPNGVVTITNSAGKEEP